MCTQNMDFHENWELARRFWRITVFLKRRQGENAIKYEQVKKTTIMVIFPNPIIVQLFDICIQEWTLWQSDDSLKRSLNASVFPGSFTASVTRSCCSWSDRGDRGHSWTGEAAPQWWRDTSDRCTFPVPEPSLCCGRDDTNACQERQSNRNTSSNTCFMLHLCRWINKVSGALCLRYFISSVLVFLPHPWAILLTVFVMCDITDAEKAQGKRNCSLRFQK